VEIVGNVKTASVKLNFVTTLTNVMLVYMKNNNQFVDKNLCLVTDWSILKDSYAFMGVSDPFVVLLCFIGELSA